MMARTKKKRQPKALDSSLAIRKEPEVYKAGLHAELQKFEDISGYRQLKLSEVHNDETEIEISGLDFSISEDKAFSAIQILLDKTDYKGNEPGMVIHSEDFRDSYLLPKLSMTFSEYLEAYGLKKSSSGRYSRAQRDKALEALESLTKPRRIVYERIRFKNRKKSTDLIVAMRPLISLMEGYSGLDEQEAEAVKAGQSNAQRVKKLVIECSPLFVDQIDTFYMLKPVRLHEEIKQLTGKARISRAVSLFIEWLLTKNMPQVKIDRDKLAKKLRLEYLIEQRKPALVKKRLDEAFQVAKDLDYLLDYDENAFGMMTFQLNPEKIRRITKKMERANKRANK